MRNCEFLRYSKDLTGRILVAIGEHLASVDIGSCHLWPARLLQDVYNLRMLVKNFSIGYNLFQA
jgi:hypothetical protein